MGVCTESKQKVKLLFMHGVSSEMLYAWYTSLMWRSNTVVVWNMIYRRMYRSLVGGVSERAL